MLEEFIVCRVWGVSGRDGGQVEWRYSPDGGGAVGQRVEDAGLGRVCR